MAFNDVGAFEILEAGKYRLKVDRIEEATGEFGPQNKWVFLVSGPAGQLMQSDGTTPYEFWAYTSNKTGPGSKAGEYFEALLDRQLVEGESGAQLATDVIGKIAEAMIGVIRVTRNGSDRNINKILQMMPLKRRAPRTATPEPEAPPEPVDGPVESPEDDGFPVAGAAEAESDIPFDPPPPPSVADLLAYGRAMAEAERLGIDTQSFKVETRVTAAELADKYPSLQALIEHVQTLRSSASPDDLEVIGGNMRVEMQALHREAAADDEATIAAMRERMGMPTRKDLLAEHAVLCESARSLGIELAGYEIDNRDGTAAVQAVVSRLRDAVEAKRVPA